MGGTDSPFEGVGHCVATLVGAALHLTDWTLIDINLDSEAEGEEYQPTERIPERGKNREPVNALHLDCENMLR